MLTIERVKLIINSINVCNLLGKPTTRHAINKNIKAISRSTTYRVVNRMLELNLLIPHRNESGDIEVSVSTLGENFIESSKDLM